MTDEAAKMLAEAIKELAAAIRSTKSNVQYGGYLGEGDKTPFGASAGGGRGADGVLKSTS